MQLFQWIEQLIAKIGDQTWLIVSDLSLILEESIFCT